MIHRFRKCCGEIPELTHIDTHTGKLWQMACRRCGTHTTASDEDSVIESWNRGEVYTIGPCSEEEET